MKATPATAGVPKSRRHALRRFRLGKRDRPRLEGFLVRHQASMPRSMLRYAIEHLPAERRRRYLQGRKPGLEGIK